MKLLNKIRLTTLKKELWFNLVDVSKLLSRRSDSICRSSNVVYKSFKITNNRPSNYINESGFRLLFKDNLQILEELEQYKSTGSRPKADQTAY